MHKLWSIIFICSLLLAESLSAQAAKNQATNKSAPDAVRILKEILQKPEADIDLAKTKLTIDRLIDPSIDVEMTLKQIDRMVSEVNNAFRPDTLNIDKMVLLKNYLYEKGEWNNRQPFQYDFEDPLGTKIENKLLPHYLASKKGNCISMPMLFIILGEKLGLNVTASLAPLHVFVKYTDPETDITYNLETTDKAGIADDSYYMKNIPITEQAIAKGVYMKPLSKKETITVMAILLSEYYAQIQQWHKSIAVADVVLEYYPNYAYAMIKKGNGYYALLQDHLDSYSSLDEIPLMQKIHLDQLAQLNERMFAQAKALGWRESGHDATQRYLKQVNERINQINLSE